MSFIDHLQQIEKYSRGKSIEGIVLKHGRLFDKPEVSRPKGIKRMIPNQCYKNAYDFCISNSGYRYVEGFIDSEIIPIQHAWVIDKDDNVIELTFREAAAQYLGIIIPISVVNRIISETKVYGALNWTSKYMWNYFESKSLTK